MEKRSSKDEKADEAPGMGRIAHWLFVHELQDILAKLDPNDIVIPNGVENLSITREDEYIGYIDFCFGDLEMNNEGEGEE